MENREVGPVDYGAMDAKEVVENQPDLPQILELDENPEKAKDLRNQLMQSNGLARILVHPLYEVREGDLELVASKKLEDKNDPVHQEYLEYLSKFVDGTKKLSAEAAEKQVPIILFDSPHDLPKTWSNFDGFNGAPVYLIYTELGSPAPLLKRGGIKTEFPLGREPRFNNDIRGIVSILADFGLKKAVVSGSYLWLRNKSDSEWIKIGKEPAPVRGGVVKRFPDRAESADNAGRGCMATVVNIMHQEGINAEYSSMFRKRIFADLEHMRKVMDRSDEIKE